MRRVSLPLAIAVLAGIVACSTMRVATDYDQDADFSQYRTYRWIPHKPTVSPRRLLDHTLTEKRIKSSVESALAVKGIARAMDQEPDFFIVFHIGAQNMVDVNTYGYRYGPRGRRWGRHVDVQRYKEGTLILDFVDRQSKQLFWRGTAADAIYRPEDLEEKLNEAVGKILEEFPPE
ncbi:DUF4136 domain-containing protein [Candidatus Zixiibacteriota bacterium]